MVVENPSPPAELDTRIRLAFFGAGVDEVFARLFKAAAEGVRFDIRADIATVDPAGVWECDVSVPHGVSTEELCGRVARLVVDDAVLFDAFVVVTVDGSDVVLTRLNDDPVRMRTSRAKT